MERKYPTYYGVKLWIDNEEHFSAGILYSANFTDAMEQIEDYYADELMSVEHLELFEEGLITTLDGEVAKLMLDIVSGAMD